MGDWVCVGRLFFLLYKFIYYKVHVHLIFSFFICLFIFYFSLITKHDYLPTPFHTRYNIDSSPVDVRASNERRIGLVALIENIEQCREHQVDIDSIYNDVCNIYHT